MRILVVGARGQLGTETVAAWQRAGGHTVIGSARADLDVTRQADVLARVAAERPDVLINCTAYNRVDAAEEEPVAAFAANAWAVRSLARAAAEAGAVFVHYSTDFVFDGTIDHPYTEEDAPNPQSAYGMSKLLGEWLAVDAPRHYVLRVESLFGGAGARSSIDAMISAMLVGREVRAFADRTVSPSFVTDVAAATMGLVEGRRPFGMYHCVNGGATTWLHLATELRRRLGRPEAPITPTSASAAGLKASRPRFAALSNAKLTSAGVPMPVWQDAIARYLETRL
jgi:dTDP-4-dehydrorhamnose reductase